MVVLPLYTLYIRISDTKTYIFTDALMGGKLFQSKEAVHRIQKVISIACFRSPNQPPCQGLHPSVSNHPAVWVKVKSMSLARRICAGTSFYHRGQNLQQENPETDQTGGLQGICYAIVCIKVDGLQLIWLSAGTCKNTTCCSTADACMCLRVNAWA